MTQPKEQPSPHTRPQSEPQHSPPQRDPPHTPPQHDPQHSPPQRDPPHSPSQNDPPSQCDLPPAYTEADALLVLRLISVLDALDEHNFLGINKRRRALRDHLIHPFHYKEDLIEDGLHKFLQTNGFSLQELVQSKLGLPGHVKDWLRGPMHEENDALLFVMLLVSYVERQFHREDWDPSHTPDPAAVTSLLKSCGTDTDSFLDKFRGMSLSGQSLNDDKEGEQLAKRYRFMYELSDRQLAYKLVAFPDEAELSDEQHRSAVDFIVDSCCALIDGYPLPTPPTIVPPVFTLEKYSESEKKDMNHKRWNDGMRQRHNATTGTIGELLNQKMPHTRMRVEGFHNVEGVWMTVRNALKTKHIKTQLTWDQAVAESCNRARKFLQSVPEFLPLIREFMRRDTCFATMAVQTVDGNLIPQGRFRNVWARHMAVLDRISNEPQ